MEPKRASQRLLKRTEACQRLGIGISTYKRLVRDGSLREIHVGIFANSRGKRLPESEVERFISARLGGER